MKKKIVLFIACVFLIFTICHLYKWKQNSLAISNCVNEAVDIGKMFGLTDCFVNMKYEFKYDDYNFYQLDFTSKNLKSLSNEDKFKCVTKLDNLFIDIDNIIVRSYVSDGNNEYSVEFDTLHKTGTLKINNIPIYTYIPEKVEDNRRIMSEYLPYEGMQEAYLEYTKLGKADEVEECIDFYKKVPRARSKTYRWYDDNENLEAIALVWYYDYADKREVDGYVHSITFYGNYK